MGMQVEIELNIPAFDLVPRPCQLRCYGRVVRVEACYQLRGFAVAGRIESDHSQEEQEEEEEEEEEEEDEEENKNKLQLAR